MSQAPSSGRGRIFLSQELLSLMSLEIRPVREEDVEVVCGLIHALARYARLESHCKDTSELLREELIGPRRNANIAKARHIAIYLAIEMCEMTTTAVGAEFGNRNHSTVSTSYKKVQKMIQEDRTRTEDLKSLRDKITLRS